MFFFFVCDFVHWMNVAKSAIECQRGKVVLPPMHNSRKLNTFWSLGPICFLASNVLYSAISANICIECINDTFHKRETMHNNIRQNIFFFLFLFHFTCFLFYFLFFLFRCGSPLCQKHYTDFKNVSIMNCFISFSDFEVL